VNLKLLAGIPGVKVHGIDYNPVRLERVKKEFPGVEIAQADLVCFKTDKKFDIVLCSQVLEHIGDDVKALENMRGLLSDPGILILGVPNEGCFLARLRNNVFEPAIKKTTDHVNFYTERSIRQKIESAGFAIIEKMHEGFFFPCQKLSSFLASSDPGFALLNLLGSLFKGQAGG